MAGDLYLFRITKHCDSWGNTYVDSEISSHTSEASARRHAIQMLRSHGLSDNGGCAVIFRQYMDGSKIRIGSVTRYQRGYRWQTEDYIKKGNLLGKRLDAKGNIGRSIDKELW